MFSYFIKVSAFVIRYLDIKDNSQFFIGQHGNKITLTGYSDALDVNLIQKPDSTMVWFEIPSQGYLSVQNNIISITQKKYDFKITLSYNGGYLISNDSNCISKNEMGVFILKNCNSTDNRFLLMNRTSITTTEQERMKFLKNYYFIKKELTKNYSYGTMTALDFVTNLEIYSLNKNRDFESVQRRDFIKLNTL